MFRMYVRLGYIRVRSLVNGNGRNKGPVALIKGGVGPASTCSHEYRRFGTSAASASLPVAVSKNGVCLGMVNALPTLIVGGVLLVAAVVAQIEADEIPRLMVFNKIDLVDWPAEIRRDGMGDPVAVHLSAHTGAGLEELRSAIQQYFQGRSACQWLHLAHAEGGIRARLYAAGAVRAERIEDDGWWLQVEGPPDRLAEMIRKPVDGGPAVAPATGHP